MSGAAAVLAAGRGMRLRPHTDHVPKALVPVAGKPVLWRIMQALYEAAAITRFTVAIGYKADAFTAFKPPAGCSVNWVVNSQWEHSNSMLSLALCMPSLRGGGFIVEGDCCFDKRLLEREYAADTWFVRRFESSDDGCCLKTDPAQTIRALSIEVRGQPPVGENAWKSCGVLRMSAPTAALAAGWLQAGIEQKRENDYYDLILADHLAEATIQAIDIGDSPWCEIDNEEDLHRAETLFR